MAGFICCLMYVISVVGLELIPWNVINLKDTTNINNALHFNDFIHAIATVFAILIGNNWNTLLYYEIDLFNNTQPQTSWWNQYGGAILAILYVIVSFVLSKLSVEFFVATMIQAFESINSSYEENNMDVSFNNQHNKHT